jgi:hypothetical protein
VDAVVKEDIRQKIIFKTETKKYLQYIFEFSNRCLAQFQKNYFIEDCATNILITLEINYTQLQQKIDNFMSQCSGDIY